MSFKINKLANIAVLLSLLALAGSCGHAGKNAEPDGEVEDFKVVETIKSVTRCFRASSGGDTVYLTQSAVMQWPEELGHYGLGALQKHLLSAAYNDTVGPVDRAMVRFVSDLSSITGEGFGIPADSIQRVDSVPSPFGGVSCYEAEVTARVQELTERSVTYDVTAMSYLGGAHPNTSSSPFTYVFELGEVMSYESLFKPGSEAQVSRAVNEAAADQYGCAPYRLASKTFFNDTLAVSHDVYWSDGAIVFHYNPYDVAPYSSGMIDVAVYPYMVSESLSDKYRKLFELE